MSDCLLENTVLDVLGRRIPEAERLRVEGHLDSCDRCRRLMAEIARTEVAGTEPSGDAAPGAERPRLPEPGTRVGPYVIERVLGRGGMGVVFAAHDPRLDRTVAIKLLRPEIGVISGAAEERLTRESRAMARLAHPNIASVFDVGHHGDQLFVAMEHVDGATLSAWLRERRRTVREILEVFRSAGEGLAAAHEARIVHRDFKPENVLVDRSGRVVVTDFGLARALSDAETGSSSGPEKDEPAQEPASASLTATGAILGTPAYMAPEQFLEGPIDARTDQFSFCVALFAAVYGERPFPGKSAAEICDAVVKGRIRPLPAGVRAPRWLRHALLRGLSSDPADRFPSMRALLDALSPRRRRRVAIAAGLALAATAGAATAFALLGGPDPAAAACTGARDRLAGVWDQERRREVRAGLVAPQTPQAELRWRRLEQALDQWATAWEATWIESCRATTRGEQSQEVLDLRAGCLEDQLEHVRHVTAILASDDPLVAEQAIHLESGLPRAERCAAATVRGARVAPPADPALRAEVDAIRRDLVRADALRLAGLYDRALAELAALESRAEATAYRPVLAEVLHYLAIVQQAHGDPRAAHGTIRRSALIAEAGRHDEMAAEAWIQAVEIAVESLGDHDRAEEYAQQARAAIDRFGTSARLEAYYHHHLGILRWRQARMEEALAAFRVARRAATEAKEDEVAVAALEGQGLVHEDLGSFSEALELQLEIHDLRRREMGEDHPDLAISHTNVAAPLLSLGRFEEAEVHLRAALDLRERTLGREHVAYAMSLHNLGELFRTVGRYEEALDAFRRAQAVSERVHGEEHETVALSLEYQGGALIGLGRAGEAVELMRRAVDLYERLLGPDHLESARCRLNLAEALRESGDLEAALAAGEQGLAGMQLVFGDDHVYTGYGYTDVGLTLVELGRARQALEPLARALSIYETVEVDPVELSRARFARARALWDASPRERDRALTLARQAREALAEAGGAGARKLAGVDVWLDAR